MTRRSDNAPLLTAASSRPARHSRLTLVLTMIALLLVVLFAVFRIIPEGPVERLTHRKERREIAQAVKWEQASLHRTAAEAYEAILGDPKTGRATRYEAALRLAAIEGDRLGNQSAAESALEKAWFFAPGEDEQTQAARRLEALRGYPVKPGNASSAAGPDRTAQGLTPVADIGQETVTLEELLHAWGETSGTRPPTPEEFEPFVHHYLDMALLADEARRQGLDRRGAAALGMRMNRVIGLSRAMTELLVERLGEPDDATLQDYYLANAALFAAPARARIGHIVLSDEEQIEGVREELAALEPFGQVARRHSLDAEALPEGYVIGEITARTATIDRVGSVPGLAPFLLRCAEGETTGPLKLKRGFHWFTVLEKSQPAAPPWPKVRDRVLLRYQSGQLARARSDLLKRLHDTRPIVLHGNTPLDRLLPCRETAQTDRPTTPSSTSKAGNPEEENSKPDIRNPKQIRMTKEGNNRNLGVEQ